MRESTLQFGTARSLVGLRTAPPYGENAPGSPAIVFLNSGLIHHIGPNRLWVRLARSLAGRGFLTLRFDLSGIGDSMPVADRRPRQERWVQEVRAAMDALVADSGVDRFVLVGNCSGAALAYHTALADPRVTGAILVNPPGRRILRYLLRLGLSNRRSWLRLFHGRTRLPNLRMLLGRSLVAASAASPRRRSVEIDGLRRLVERDVDLLLVSCEWDPGYDYYHSKQRARLASAPFRDRLVLETIPGANHEFTLLANQDRLVHAVEQWTTRMRDERWRTAPQPSLR